MSTKLMKVERNINDYEGLKKARSQEDESEIPFKSQTNSDQSTGINGTVWLWSWNISDLGGECQHSTQLSLNLVLHQVFHDPSLTLEF
jgi:hypothetical protein